MFARIQKQSRGGKATHVPSPINAQRVGAFALVPALIRRLGADPVTVMAAANLGPAVLDDPENRISYAALGRLLRECVVRTGCAHFGLLAGRMWRIADLGIVGELMRNSPTVRAALRKLVLYQHLNSEGAVAFVREAANVVEVGCAIYGEHAGVEPFYDAYLAAALNFLREICGPGWTPTEVFIPHATPPDATQYRQYFKAQPRFNAEICALRFPACWMDRAIEGADPARLRAAEQKASANNRPQLLQQVYRSLRILLLSGRSSGDDVASMLSMHRRTLNRRLRALDTTFQGVLDALRFEVARQLLGASEISLDEVAAALGYAGVSPFMRSFRRWAGTTPGRWRRMAREGGLVGDGLRHDEGAGRGATEWRRRSRLLNS